jgi:hypothetical protein
LINESFYKSSERRGTRGSKEVRVAISARPDLLGIVAAKIFCKHRDPYALIFPRPENYFSCAFMQPLISCERHESRGYTENIVAFKQKLIQLSLMFGFFCNAVLHYRYTIMVEVIVNIMAHP